MTPAEAESIGRFEVAIVDVENAANNPELLSLMKMMNPKIVLIASINLTGTKMPIGSFRPIQRELIGRINASKADFWLKDAAGEPIYDPREGGVYVFNVSADSPLNRKHSGYIDFAADFYTSIIFSGGAWSGFKIEDSWNRVIEEAVSGRYAKEFGVGGQDSNIDADADGQPDDIVKLVMAWRKGVEDFIELMKAKNGQSFVAIK